MLYMTISRDANEGFAVPEPQNSVFKLNKALIMSFIPRLANGWGIKNTTPKFPFLLSCRKVGEIIMSNDTPQTICIHDFT